MNHKIRNILLGALLAIGLGVPYLQAADVAISALPAGSALGGTEPIPMVQAAATKQTTPAAIATYLLSGSSTTEVLANNAGAFDGDSGFTFNATNNSVDLGGATLTASDPVLDLSQTWNNAGVTFTGIKLAITSTASATASRPVVVAVGGSDVFAVDKVGAVYAGGSTSNAAVFGKGSYNLDAYIGADFYFGNGSAMYIAGNIPYGWATVNSINGTAPTADLYMYRDAAAVWALRNGTTAQTLRVYDTYTDASNYGRLALNTNLTGDWVQVAAETAGTGGDNYGIALTPTGTGAISAHVPDSAATGGNARGGYAVDWQTNRDAASKVASGTSSVIGGGSSNIASATNTVVAGGSGNVASGNISGVASGGLNTASGVYAFVGGGNSNTASGENSWIPGGSQATTRNLNSAFAYSAGQRSAPGDAQVIGQPVRRTTTDATPVSLAADGTPAAATVMVLPSDSTATCESIVTANSTAAGVVSMAGFRADAIVKNDSSTMTISGGTCTAIGTADAALTTATCALVVNGTRDSIEIEVTGVAATTVYWVAEVKCVQAL